MTPNLTDDNFAGNSSGVSLVYKLLPFVMNINDKERYFTNGLMERFGLYNQFFVTSSQMQYVSVSDVAVDFTYVMPKNELELSQVINNLLGIVDRETLVSQLPFVTDPKKTVEIAEEESKANSPDPTPAQTEIPDSNNINM